MAYDVIVVGARCAGSPVAMLLARQGHKVLLVDRSSFPSDRLSTHLVKRTGASYLRDWNLLDPVIEWGTPRIRRQTLHVGGVALRGCAPPYRGVDADVTPRRTYLDKLLFDAAATAGVEVRPRFGVSELLYEDRRVVGIRGGERDGPVVEERARVVVGADGLRSLVARRVGARTYFDAGSLSCGYYAYFSGIRDRDDLAEGYFLDSRNLIITFPTNDGLDLVFILWPAEEADRVRADRDAAFFQSLQAVPELHGRVRSGVRETGYAGMAAMPNFFREAHGPGWALIGDAAHHRDPVTAQGISGAFLQAAILAEELNTVFADDAPLHLALARYDQRQLAGLKPMFDYTVSLARLAPSTATQRELMQTMSTDAAKVNAFVGAFIGSVPLGEVFPQATLDDFAREVSVRARSQRPGREVA